LLLTKGLTFSYRYVISDVESTWAATLEDTINVGEGLIALSFNPSDDNLYAATELTDNVSIIEPRVQNTTDFNISTISVSSVHLTINLYLEDPISLI